MKLPEINYPLLIDGGLSNVLEAKGHHLSHPLWTSQILVKDQEAIIRAHIEYLIAGAQCITTSSYQSTVSGFLNEGYSPDEAREFIRLSVTLAEMAITEAARKKQIDSRSLIAASVGPYGAYLADGSEYRGNYSVSDETLEEFHATKIYLLSRSNADLLAVETIPSFREAKILSNLLTESQKPVWVSFSCRNEREINDGTPIEECVSLFDGHSTVFATGVNCTAPRHVSGLIKRIKNAVDRKVIVYPNSGELYEAKTKSWSGSSDPDNFAQASKRWLDDGADIIGGCCRIGPSHILKMKQQLNTGH